MGLIKVLGGPGPARGPEVAHPCTRPWLLAYNFINVSAFAEVGGYEALLDKYVASEAAPEYTAYEYDPITNTNK